MFLVVNISCVKLYRYCCYVPWVCHALAYRATFSVSVVHTKWQGNYAGNRVCFVHLHPYQMSFKQPQRMFFKSGSFQKHHSCETFKWDLIQKPAHGMNKIDTLQEIYIRMYWACSWRFAECTRCVICYSSAMYSVAWKHFL